MFICWFWVWYLHIYDSVVRGSCCRCFCIQRTSFGDTARVWILYIVGYTYHIPYTAYRITYQPPYQYDTPTPDIIYYYLPHPPILGTYENRYIKVRGTGYRCCINVHRHTTHITPCSTVCYHHTNYA